MRVEGTDVKRKQRGRRRAEPPRVSRRVVRIGRPAVPVAAVPVAAVPVAAVPVAAVPVAAVPVAAVPVAPVPVAPVPAAAVPAAAVLAAGLLLAGCVVQPLAVQEPFMNPLNATATAVGERVSGAVAEGRARQAAARACNREPRDGCPPEPAVAPRSDPRALKALEEWESGEPRRPSGEHAGSL